MSWLLDVLGVASKADLAEALSRLSRLEARAARLQHELDTLGRFAIISPIVAQPRIFAQQGDVYPVPRPLDGLAPLKDLEESLGAVAREFRLPEGVDLTVEHPDYKWELPGGGFGDDDKTQPPEIYANLHLRKDHYTIDKSKKKPPCNTEFIVLFMKGEGGKDFDCKTVNFVDWFHEARLRACWEATQICQGTRCHLAKPTRILKLWAVCGENPWEKYASVAFYFGFECIAT